MRILVLNHEYPPIGGGGGQAARLLARELALRGHEIIVITAHIDNLAREEVLDGCRIVRIPSLRKDPYRAGFLTMAAYVLAAIQTGLNLIHTWRPDLIHAHFAVPAGATAWSLSRLTGVPYLLTSHLGDIPGGVPEKTDRWFRWIMPFTKPIWQYAARVSAVSEYTSSLIQQNYPITPIVIPNGIQIKAVDSARLQAHRPPVIIFAGRFVPQKNLGVLVETLSMVRDLPWKCTLIGDGPLFNEIDRMITANGIADRFSLPGWIEPDEVLGYMAHSDLLFMPSLSEGLSVAGLQGLANGLAILASNAEGNRDLVAPGQNGYLVDPNDPGALSSALRNLIANPENLSAARRASLALAERFDIRRVTDRYESIFEEIVS